MKRLIITESEKKSILKKYNLILESGEIKSLPLDIQNKLKNLGKLIKRDITDSDVAKELKQEGKWTNDNGGEDSQAKKQINKLLLSLKTQFPKVNSKIVSGYRSYDDQVKNFSNKVNKGRSFDDVQSSVTLPGFSQHHTGKSFDIVSVEESWWESNPKVEEWVKNNCGKFGFKISYPQKGVLRKKEPWHLFYIGGETSNTEEKKIDDKKIDDYYKSPEVDDKFEKQTEVVYKKSACKPVNKYTPSPSLDDVKDSKSVIRIGHEGEPVKLIQMLLQKLKYDLGKCGSDGLFGIKTKKAVEQFQEDNSINPISSSIDSKTLELLVSLSESNKPNKNKVDNKSQNKSSTVTKNKDAVSTTDKDYVIIKSKNYTGKNLHVLFAGRHTYQGGVIRKNLESYIKKLEPYSNNSIIVITHWNNTVDKVSKYVNDKLGLEISSIAGFSQGGKHVWEYRNNTSFKLVGLIDPLIYDKNKTLGSNTFLMCNPKNWGGQKYVDLCKEVLTWYCENQKKYSGHVECNTSGHWNMLDVFYQKYGNRI